MGKTGDTEITVIDANKLGVRYVVEASVRKIGKRIRITAQLVDAETGNYVWAERYDRNLIKLFELQDEVIRLAINGQGSR